MDRDQWTAEFIKAAMSHDKIVGRGRQGNVLAFARGGGVPGCRLPCLTTYDALAGWCFDYVPDRMDAHAAFDYCPATCDPTIAVRDLCYEDMSYSPDY